VISIGDRAHDAILVLGAVPVNDVSNGMPYMHAHQSWSLS